MFANHYAQEYVHNSVSESEDTLENKESTVNDDVVTELSFNSTVSQVKDDLVIAYLFLWKDSSTVKRSRPVFQ